MNLMNEKTSCYCCARTTTSTAAGPSKMDLDVALNELGMLSSVTESRKQYLQEKNRTHSESSLKDYSSSNRKNKIFQVIRIDPTYVKGFSFDSTPFYNSISDDKPVLPQPDIDFGRNYRLAENDFEKEARCNRLSRIRLGRMRRFRRPYEVPWRLYHSFQEMDLNSESPICNSSNNHQSKSNSTTPVKSDSPLTLPRSRSLGNLDLAKLKLTDLFDSDKSHVNKEDIENVSQDMKNMHVSE